MEIKTTTTAEIKNESMNNESKNISQCQRVISL